MARESEWGESEGIERKRGREREKREREREREERERERDRQTDRQTDRTETERESLAELAGAHARELSLSDVHCSGAHAHLHRGIKASFF